MYCSIQEVERKIATKGFMTSLKVNVDKSDIVEKYLYDLVKEPYNRPIKTAYKITINQCFRENKKVKKNQYSIGTVGYYDFLRKDY